MEAEAEAESIRVSVDFFFFSIDVPPSMQYSLKILCTLFSDLFSTRTHPP